MTMTTTAPLNSGSGSLKGIADHVSLPNMSASCLSDGSTPSGTGDPVAGARDCLIDDALEQIGLDWSKGLRGHGRARLRQCGIGRLIERRPGAVCLVDPGLEISRRHCLRDEMHVRK